MQRAGRHVQALRDEAEDIVDDASAEVVFRPLHTRRRHC
jgi:hypothetical protein